MKQTYVFLTLLLSIISLNAQEGILYTLKDGLSNSLINSVCQDSEGFIWVATDYGLNRFDGLNFKVFNLTNNRSQTIKTNRFNSIRMDKDERLIVGTQSGLYYFDQDSETLEPITIPEVPELSQSQVSSILIDSKNNVWASLSGLGIVCIAKNTDTSYSLKLKRFQSNLESVSCLFESSDNDIWIGTRNHGAFKVSPDFVSMTHYHASAEEELKLVGDCVFTIAEDQKQNIIIGVFESGITIIDNQKQEVRNLRLKKEDPRSLVCYILVDSNNQIIVGSDAEGLYTLDPEQMKLTPFALSVQNINMRKSKIHVIFEDKFQNLWVAAHQQGIVVIPKESKLYQFIGHDPYNNNFPNNSILSITQDKHKNFWVGTDGGGLVKYNSQDGYTEVFAQNTSNPFPDNIVLATYSNQDTLWVGTYLSGAIKMNTKTGKQIQFTHDDTKNSISSNYINAIVSDLDKRIWFGTGDYGVCCLETNGVFKDLYEYTNQYYTLGFIYNLYCDRSNTLWVSSEKGVFTIDVRNRILDNLPTLNKTLLNSAVYCTREDKDGIIWLSNINGLIRYNPVTADVKILCPQYSIGNNIVNAIEIDDNGHIWGSTSTGIFKYQPDTDVFSFYPAYIGIPNNEFNMGVSFKNEQSKIFFGGITGISHFLPSEYEINKDIQQVYLTELRVHNEPVTVNDNVKQELNHILEKSIVRTDTIKLAHNQNNFSIQFVAFEYAFLRKIHYKYMLEGNDTEWDETDYKNNTAYYTGINHGEYTFRVIASFDPLFKNYTEKKLKIIINPPIWLSWWAKMLYVLFSVALIYYIFRHIIRRINMKQELLKEKHAAEILEAQLVSFTNISHEIRTPLTIIIGLLKKLIKRKEANPEKAYWIMMNNGNKILDLINQLLDVHMLDAGVLQLQFDHIDIIDYVEEIVEIFRPLASESDISISLNSDMENSDAIIDTDAFSKIIYNLLGNAIKFTPQGGQIKVSVSWSDDETFKMTVSDTGIGISEDRISKVFDRFYKSDNALHSELGMGIGLHLVKSLVELMNGSIAVCSEVGKGTTFTVVLPIVGKKKETSETIESIKTAPVDSFKEDEQKANAKTNYRIVLVEDNEDILNFISEELDRYYKIVTFSAAKAAYKYILEHRVDLIVSDVMMPDIDGFKFCKMVKSNPKTELIPVILLTAKNDHKSQIQGAKEGADVYMTKPFMIEILLAKINNLIHIRKAISNKYSHNYEVGVVGKIEEHRHPNDKLIEQFIAIVKSQIDNPELSIESLSVELGVSRANLYRKIKSITNQTPSVFIRNIRLEQAAVLLKKQISSSEVTYLVGFNSHSYFSKLFLEYYGCSPSQYMSENNSDETS